MPARDCDRSQSDAKGEFAKWCHDFSVISGITKIIKVTTLFGE